MFVARPAQPLASQTPAAILPTAALRRAWTWLWWSVRAHVADLHGIARPDL